MKDDDWITDMCIWALVTDVYEEDTQEEIYETSIELQDGELIEEIEIVMDDE